MRTLEDRLTQASDEARLQVNRIDTRSATSIRSRQQLRRRLTGMVAVAAMFIVFGASALVMSTQTGQDSASEPSTPPTTSAPVAEASTAPPTSPPAASDITHLVGKITASSELSAEFGSTMLIDGNLERGWNDASLKGVGAEIVIEFTEPVAITELIVHPYTNEEQFQRNYWVQGYEIHTDDLEKPVTGRFVNSQQPNAIGLNTTETLTLTLTVVTTFPAERYGDGPPFDELAIAEIQIFGTPLAADITNAATTTTISVPTDPTVPIDPEIVSHWYEIATEAGGEPVRDDEIGRTGAYVGSLVPGSGFALATSNQNQPAVDEMGIVMYLARDSVESDQIWTCISDYAIVDAEPIVGGGQCTSSAASELLWFGLSGSGSCIPSPDVAPQLVSVWGIPDTATEVRFNIGDGQTETVPVTSSGTAQIVIAGQVPVWSLDFDGITDDHRAVLDQLLPSNQNVGEVCGDAGGG